MTRCLPALLCVTLYASNAVAGQEQILPPVSQPVTSGPSLSDLTSQDLVAPGGGTFSSPSPNVVPPALLRPIVNDFKNLFTMDSARAMAVFAGGAVAVSSFDQRMVQNVVRTGPEPVFDAGQVAGAFLIHAGAGAGTYFFGRATGNMKAAYFGSDFLRAQLLSGVIVQAGKLATHRERPDGSNYYSLPSGHAATAFASAGVIQRHFGWTAGIPAYTFASYVAASRVSNSKHHLSDVVLGAGIGLISARAVTVKLGERKFGVQVAPTQGGAAISFSPR